MAKPRKTVTEDHRTQVRTMTVYGMPQAVIGKLLGFAPKTLRKWFRNELDFGGAQANAEMAGYLFKNGKEGNVVAQIFWLKTRAGWKEPVRVVHSGSVGHYYDFSKVADDDLKRLEGILAAAAIAGSGKGGNSPPGS
jgi:hypothetical protein